MSVLLFVWIWGDKKDVTFLFTLDKFNKLCPTSKFKLIVDALLDNNSNIELENSKDLSAALVSQKWDDKTYKAVEYCDFKVIAKTPRHNSGATRGIFASIRQMNLRKGASNECIDYVLFEVGSGVYQKSQKMCGTIDGDEVYEVSNFFEAPGGTMKVIVFINRYVTLESGSELGIEFSFTSYDGNECIIDNPFHFIIIFAYCFIRLQFEFLGMSIEKVHFERP